MGAALPFGVWVWPLSEHNREIPVRPANGTVHGSCSQQVIVTSRTLTRPRKQERIQKFRGDLLDAANLLLNEVPVQDVQDILLRTKATADRAFVSEILLHSFAQDAMEYRSCSHCRTSSPSPQPTSRRDSIATLL